MAKLIEPIRVANDTTEDALVVAKEDECHLACYCNGHAKGATLAKDVKPHSEIVTSFTGVDCQNNTTNNRTNKDQRQLARKEEWAS